MFGKFKNIIIFVGIGVVLFLGYTFFIKGDGVPEEDLVSETPINSGIPAIPTTANVANPTSSADFLTLLLSVKNIKLSDSIFADPAFSALTDSSILLTPDGDEGRPNPFAPFFSEDIKVSEAGAGAGAQTQTGTGAGTTPPTTLPSGAR
jgi:hypothetical protein